MNTRRLAALALAACAASLSVTACTAGITTTAVGTTSPARASSAATGRTASAATVVPSPARSGNTVALGGSVGSFPVPPGARIGGTSSDRGAIVLIFGSVTPAKVSSFYAAALPRAGYTIDMNSVASQGGDTVAIVEFTGHGYKGNIDALSSLPSNSATIGGVGHKNVTTISFQPK